MKRSAARLSVFIIVLTFQFILIPSLNAQVLNSVLDKPGGSGSPGNVASDDGNGTTGLYILAGAALAAILIYKFVLEEPSREEEENEEEEAKKNSTAEKPDVYSIYEEKFPLDVYLGIKNNFPNLPDQSVVMGVTLKF